MTKILVPTDFSPTAEMAFQFALRLASNIESEIVLYHVFTPLENLYIDTEEERDAYNVKTSAELYQKLDDLKAKAHSDYSSITITTVLGRSPIIESILGYAESNQFQMIIMGTQGASGIKKVIIGSQAARIIEDAKIPVLLIPDEFSGEIPKKVLFATTCNVQDKDALSTVLKWTAPLNPKFTIVHICEDETNGAHPTLKDYDAAIPVAFDKNNIAFRRVSSSYATETMEKLATDFPYDMLAMIRRKKTFFGRIFLKSLSRDMAYLTTCPLLIVPEK